MTVQYMEELLMSDEFGKAGELAAHSWPGCYPILYITEGGEWLCADCATREMKLWQVGESDDPPITCDAHWEGEPMNCDACGKEIESAYGPVESAGKDYPVTNDNSDYY